MTPKKQKQQHRIFEAALALFARHGLKKTTVAAVAGQLGMTKGNLYFYVKDKADLYQKTIHWALTQWQDQVSQAMADHPLAPDKFAAMARAAVAHIETRPDLQLLLVQDPGILTLDRKSDRFPEANQAAIDLIRDILDLGVRQGTFRVQDPDAAARYLFSLYMMFLIQAYVFLDKEDFSRMFDTALGLSLRGLTPP